MATQSANLPPRIRRAIVGFAVSLASGVLSLLVAFPLMMWALTYRPSPSFWGNLFRPDSYVNSLIPGAKENVVVLAAVAAVSAVIVIVGAILIYKPGKETFGGTLVIVFSMIGLISLGFPIAIYNIIGIAGGAVGLTKH